jgi:hypothetical protein
MVDTSPALVKAQEFSPRKFADTTRITRDGIRRPAA